jgi:hypothetical protein
MTNFKDVLRLVAGSDSPMSKALDAKTLPRDASKIGKLYENYPDASRRRDDLQKDRDANPINRVEKEGEPVAQSR